MSENPAVTFLGSSDSDVAKCQRCKQENAVLITRKEPFCKACFIRFIRGKQRKQMQDDKYKVKYGALIEKLGTQRVLLALSGGESSLVLLDVMASLLQEQYEAHKGKQGFELVILNLNEFELNSLNKRISDILPELVKRYEPVPIHYKVLDLNSYILDDSILEKIILHDDFTGITLPYTAQTKYTLFDILKLCPNKSSIEDLLTIIYQDLIARTAYIEGCQTIIYGHSMTRIANEIIALTVKGRGSTIYQAIADHTIAYNDKELQILFPLRDVLYAEILAYAKLTGLDESVLVSTIPKSKINKNLTIRDLTTRYFSQLDATGYASTASTVVKTGEKLGAPKVDDNVGTVAHCQICGIEIYQDPGDWLRNITVNKAAPVETEQDHENLQLYKDSVGVSSQSTEVPHGNPLNICYGCIVTLGGVKQESGFIWPTNNTSPIATQQYIVDSDREKQRVLDEFVLTDDEGEDEGE
ncbi:cytoplasmic tRNA 2-thiolation protein 2 [Scheffersomyces amazonensis]|uniref:cytoplasmic tRNA 2-thiolation protein 2 n=1 Tax=Scheffersomyces amazonensis TaxID=1078765 RepID=UPI00315DDBC3